MAAQNYEIPEDLKIPVTVITGFLGAGKTTLLNHILTTNHGKKFAVVENEFGEIGIDTDLVQDKKFMAEEIVSMDNGCLCCTVREDLVKSIRQLLTLGKKFDGIIIETTGMADPAPVVQTFYQNEDLRRRCKIDGVITVVDSKHCREHLFKKIEKGEGQAEVVNECMQQVAFADRILLNKTDLVTADELAQLRHDVTTLNKLADAHECQRGKVDPELLININQFSLEKALDFDPEFLKDNEHGHSHGDHDHSNCDHDAGKCEHEEHGHGHGEKKEHGHGHGENEEHGHGHGEKKEHGHGHGEDHSKCDHDAGHSHAHGHSHAEEHSHGHSHGEKFKPQTRHDMEVKSVGIKLEPGQDMNLGQLQNWIGELVQVHGEQLYRYKGIISVKGFEEKFVFQGVHMLFDGNFMGAWTEPEGQRISKFVFIGKFKDEPPEGQQDDGKVPVLTRKCLEEGFKDCISKPLRFAVGTFVEARVKGGFKKGEIIKQWDHGNPYRIKLVENGVEVYGPMDDDRVVRKAAD